MRLPVESIDHRGATGRVVTETAAKLVVILPRGMRRRCPAVHLSQADMTIIKTDATTKRTPRY